MTKSINCPYCHRFTALSRRVAWASPHGEYWIGECNSCHFAVLVNDARNEVFPHPLPSGTDQRIGEKVQKDIVEAKLCFSVGAYRATASMARRALQATCLDKGADEKKPLIGQIDDLTTKGILTKELQSWAHEVRHLGNDGAHPCSVEDEQEVTEQDAKDILDLLEQFCQVLYVASAIAESRRKRRETK